MTKHLTRIALAGGLLFLLGCKKKEDNVIATTKPAENIAPTLVLTTLTGKSIQTDTVKIGLKSHYKEATYYLKIDGDQNQKDITLKAINGTGSLTIAGQPEGTVKLGNGTHILTWKPTSTGTTLLSLELRDSHKNIREASVEVTAVSNLGPVAALKIEKLGGLAPLEYLIDASTSYDRDANYGGGVVTYEYTIAGKKFKTDKPSIKWIFETAGTYQLGVKVADADGAIDQYASNFTVK